MEHDAYAHEIAPEAARLYGQEWGNLKQHSKEIWLNTVRETKPSGGETHMEKCAGQAIQSWYDKQAGVAAAAPTVKTASKKASTKKKKIKK